MSNAPQGVFDFDSLLRREPVELDVEAAASMLEGRTILVTGAGGSVGSELCRQILRLKPASLILLGRGENRIFQIERELSGFCGRTALQPVIADVRDAARMARVFEDCRPELLFHAAAHKHVPLMEACIGEAIQNNLFGTQCLADLADRFQVGRFVLISSDKSVRPRSAMGLSKHLAEQYVLGLARKSATRFLVARFGNVLGSACSVAPIFEEQIRGGGPVTITDPAMTRFFMTIPEAAQFVLQAAAMAGGGEIFVLDMGEPIRIIDLAKAMIRHMGLSEGSIKIAFSGVRPGEKLHEDLYNDGERTLDTSHPRLRIACHAPVVLADVQSLCGELAQLIHLPNDQLRDRLQQLIPEYHPLQRLQSPMIDPPVARTIDV